MEAIPSHITYAATREGKIWCLRKQREIVPFIDQNGYARVYLTSPSGTKAYSVHRLIAETYVPNPDAKPEVDHIDRNRSNNCVENLRWATDSEQMLNTGSKNGKHKRKFIHHECVGNYECYVIQIQNSKFRIKRRFDTRRFTLEQVIEERNAILTAHNIPIID